MKVSVVSPANIAFIKYWGRADHQIFLPRNNNISMTMSGCATTTTVETGNFSSDDVQVKFFEKEYTVLEKDSIKAKNIFDQIERIRDLAKSSQRVRIKSENNFPADAGIASSASSFSALTAALLLAFGLNEKFEDKVELSRQVRLCGSGSAIRSVYGGFVEFLTGHDHETSYAVQIADENYWDLVDLVAVVDPEKKKISSSECHQLADTSPYFETRIKEMQPRIDIVRQAILDRDFRKLGPEIERDSNSLHIVMMTQIPAAFYWAPGTISIMKSIMDWREDDDLQAYFTIDAGANVHVICEKKDAVEVKKRLQNNEYVKWIIENKPCAGTHIISEHLF
ncbi:MAG: diphosphomevalonate decarboxylase [bacterium]